MNERTYSNSVERLRSPERMERLEVKRVVDICLEGETINLVLDIGVGSGLFAEEFMNRNIVIAGIDINPEMIKAAGSYLPGCEFKLAPAEEIPYNDGSFDMAFMGLILHEADDIKKALSEAKRVSKKLVGVLEWNYREEEIGPKLEHRIKEDDLKKIAADAGFLKAETIQLNKLVLYKLYIRK